MNTTFRLRPPVALALGTGVLAAWLSVLANALGTEDASTVDPSAAAPRLDASGQRLPTPAAGASRSRIRRGERGAVRPSATTPSARAC
jgi:hypothetical protein